MPSPGGQIAGMPHEPQAWLGWSWPGPFVSRSSGRPPTLLNSRKCLHVSTQVIGGVPASVQVSEMPFYVPVQRLSQVHLRSSTWQVNSQALLPNGEAAEHHTG